MLSRHSGPVRSRRTAPRRRHQRIRRARAIADHAAVPPTIPSPAIAAPTCQRAAVPATTYVGFDVHKASITAAVLAVVAVAPRVDHPAAVSEADLQEAGDARSRVRLERPARHSGVRWRAQPSHKRTRPKGFGYVTYCESETSAVRFAVPPLHDDLGTWFDCICRALASGRVPPRSSASE